MSDDEKIYAYCDANRDDIRCKCLYPEPDIIRIGSETRLPYYCWYEPCKLKDALLTRSLKKNISRCNVSDCNISLGRVSLIDGILHARNVCGSKSLERSELASVRYLNQETTHPIIDPKWIPLALLFVSLLFFVRW